MSTIAKQAVRGLAILSLAGLSGCVILLPNLEPRPDPAADHAGRVDFERQIKPLFEHRCVRCHNGDDARAGLDFQNPETILKGTRIGTSRRFIIPGDPGNSFIFQVISRPIVHPKTMPADGWGLTKAQVQQFRKWIDEGAEWPSGKAGQVVERNLRIELEDYRRARE